MFDIWCTFHTAYFHLIYYTLETPHSNLPVSKRTFTERVSERSHESSVPSLKANAEEINFALYDVTKPLSDRSQSHNSVHMIDYHTFEMKNLKIIQQQF